MKIIGLIQARMGSTRLPGKVMMPLANKPLVWHITERLRNVNSISQIVLATTLDPRNDVLEKFSEDNGIKCHRHKKENDIVSRLHTLSKELNYDVMVKVNADCPLVDFSQVNDLLKIFIENKLDFASNKFSKTFPLGYSFEILSKAIIDHCNSLLRSELDRELFIKWIMENRVKFKTDTLYNKENLSHYNLTIDTKEDYRLISEIFSKLYNKSNFFGMKSVINYLEKSNEQKIK